MYFFWTDKKDLIKLLDPRSDCCWRPIASSRDPFFSLLLTGVASLRCGASFCFYLSRGKPYFATREPYSLLLLPFRRAAVPTPQPPYPYVREVSLSLAGFSLGPAKAIARQGTSQLCLPSLTSSKTRSRATPLRDIPKTRRRAD